MKWPISTFIKSIHKAAFWALALIPLVCLLLGMQRHTSLLMIQPGLPVFSDDGFFSFMSFYAQIESGDELSLPSHAGLNADERKSVLAMIVIRHSFNYRNFFDPAGTEKTVRAALNYFFCRRAHQIEALRGHDLLSMTVTYSGPLDPNTEISKFRTECRNE